MIGAVAAIEARPHRHLLERLQAFAREIDFEVALEPIRGSAGWWCDP